MSRQAVAPPASPAERAGPPSATPGGRGRVDLRIAIILGSTRPGREAEHVARWAHDVASRGDDARFEVLDLADFGLPMLDQPMPLMGGEVVGWTTALRPQRTTTVVA
jgi:hypothetical protein